LARANNIDPDEIPQLSVVAVSRNDDHGGDMLGRMQHFVNGVIAQCRKHELKAELILVEWNPPPGRPALDETLEWPQDLGPVTVRIVTVPPDVHAQFPHSEKLPLFQMIGKNVGVRRARGRYVLVTNVDILLDDETVIFLRDRLTPGSVLRIDRYDVPGDLDKGVSFDRVLAECRRRFFQINTRFGTLDVRRRRFVGSAGRIHWWLLALYTEIRIFGLGYPLRRTMAEPRDSIFSLWRALRRLAGNLSHYLANVPRGLKSVAKQIAKGWRLLGPSALFLHRSAAERRFARSQQLHTNACGDFTLLARDDWFRLRGYPEWPIFSWHVDSVFLFAADANDIRQIVLGPKCRIFHIDHSVGSGWSPEGAAQLFARLDKKGIPYLGDDDVLKLRKIFANDPLAAIANDENWGLGGIALPEREAIFGTKFLNVPNRMAGIDFSPQDRMLQARLTKGSSCNAV
jgi:hypothetical protein